MKLQEGEPGGQVRMGGPPQWRRRKHSSRTETASEAEEEPSAMRQGLRSRQPRARSSEDYFNEEIYVEAYAATIGLYKPLIIPSKSAKVKKRDE